MAGERILIVDGASVQLKLTRILLVNEGYTVATASSGEQALELLRGFHPALVLTSLQLPGIDGLELARRIRQAESTRDVGILALASQAGQGTEEEATAAGVDGFITRPVDARSLGARIREHLNRRTAALYGAAAPAKPAAASRPVGIPAEDLLALRQRFLEEGREMIRGLIVSMDGDFTAEDAQKQVHTWIGTGGLLGYSNISHLARQAETLLMERPVQNDALREALDNLTIAFNSPEEARQCPLPDHIHQSLAGITVGMVALRPVDAERLRLGLRRVGAKPVAFDAAEPPDSEIASGCDFLVADAGSLARSPWLGWLHATRRGGVLIAGDHDSLLSLDPEVQGLAGEFLIDAWEPEEALLRMSVALSRDARSNDKTKPGLHRPAGPVVLVADDDKVMVEIVCTTLENFGMHCRLAADGSEALRVLRESPPDAAILDINMPSLDGYQVLSAIREDHLPVHVLLLTARQQENDVLRGFRLGADDYMVKPFSPLELVARVKRLLHQ